jgi:hypothetical protein
MSLAHEQDQAATLAGTRKTIRDAAPQSNHHSCRNKCADNWYTPYCRLALDAEMEETHNQKNGKQPNHNRTQKPIRGAAASNQLTQKTNNSGNNQPDLYRQLAIGGIC